MYSYLISDDIYIRRQIIDSIKSGRAWSSVTSKLPQKDFDNLQSVINESLAKHIWLLLIDDESELKGRPKTNGSPIMVQKYLSNEGIDVSINSIKSIKGRTSWVHVTSKIENN